MRLFLLLPLLAAACAPVADDEPLAFTLLSANVGNILLSCEPYLYNLCDVEVEERLRAGIAEHAPDLVLLQEVVGDEQCGSLDEEDPGRTCHPAHLAAEPSMARRLLGPEYSVACDARGGFECVGVRRSFGGVAGCGEGERCEPADTAAPGEGCDGGFTVSAVSVEPHASSRSGGAAFRVVNGHPPSGFEAACRAGQLEQAFTTLAGEGPALVGGDLNIDPWEDVDEAVAVWDEHVGEGARFALHSGPAEAKPPLPTSVTPLGRLVLDHVLSDFLEGSCVTLGEAEGSERLDGGEGTDHRALSCALSLPPADG